MKTKSQVNKPKPHIDQALPKAKWNFDLGDCNKILRIDSEDDIVPTIIDFLKNHNYHFEELT